MPFPLPRNPDFIKEVVSSWIDDVDDRLLFGDLDGARLSLQTAHRLYLSLPAGAGDTLLEEGLVKAGVNIEQHSQKQYANCN
jgi:hypothetical protein